MMGFLDDVDKELLRARMMHGPMASAHEGYAVILEELDEIKQEVFWGKTAGKYDRLYKELVQCAAMCARLAEDVCEGKMSL
jgi:hypothetical protein